MEGIDLNAIIKGGIIVALIAQISLILKSTTAVLGFLKEHFVSKSQYAEDRLQAEKDEAARKEWMVKHVDERADHKATQALTIMLSKLQSLEDKIGMWMTARDKTDANNGKILIDMQARLREIEISCASHNPTRQP